MDWLNLGGEINPSLVHLKHLHYLDLSNNDFGGINIPSFIGSLKKMRHLDLSDACFSGTIPPDLGNLSSLHYLNLHCFCLQNYEIGLMAGSLQWLSGLSSLRYLNMSEVDLSGTATDWLDHVNMLPVLLELDLQGCRLHNLPSSLPFVNFTSLAVLQLSINRFNSSIIPQWLTKLNSLSTLVLSATELQGPIPNALGTMTSLQYIDLSSNQIDGRIPRSFGSLCNLKELSLTGNNISGEITDFFDDLSACPNKSLERLELAHNRITGLLPNSIGSLKNLKSLNLHGNRMNGTIPESVGGLSMLSVLVLSGNSWEGALSESHFTNLAKLEEIGISSTSCLQVVAEESVLISSNQIRHPIK